MKADSDELTRFQSKCPTCGHIAHYERPKIMLPVLDYEVFAHDIRNVRVRGDYISGMDVVVEMGYLWADIACDNEAHAESVREKILHDRDEAAKTDRTLHSGETTS